MTTVERVRNIPLQIEKEVPMAVDDEENNSGFPFDRDFDRDRDDSLRSQLDDIAKRHPEFAEHLEGFPFRSDSLGRRSSRPPRPSDESEFRRFSGRPFGSGRFERFGFPFTRDPFEDDEFDRSEEPRSHHHQHQQPQQSRTEQQQNQPKEESQKPSPERKSRRQNIQPSNTVDLGQKQEPVNDRNQRSMSAPPPDNRTGQQRFVSSINIPINRDGGMGDMGSQQSQQPQAQPQQQEKPVNKPTERVIPIHVEGRDEPVMPKHTGPTFGQSPQPERVFGQSPQPERIFGHRPSQFTQFVGREPPRQQYTSGGEWHHPAFAKHQETTPADAMRQQQQQKFQQQQQQQQQQQVPPQKPQEQVPPQPQEQQQQQQQSQQQQQQQSKPPSNPIEIIQSIQRDVSELMGQVEKFNGVPKDKQYLYLDEMLTRNLIKLDNIDTQGQENIRQARKEAIKCIERCIGILDAKAAANVPKQEQPQEEGKEEKMNVETKSEEQQQQPQPTEEQKTEESQPMVEEKMEVEVNKANADVNETKVEEKVEDKVEPKTEQQPPVEEKMEIVSGPAVLVVAEEQEQPTANVEEKSSEISQPEKIEDKPSDQDVTSVSEEPEQNDGEAAKETNPEESTSDDKKEKKKGKKKVVKK